MDDVTALLLAVGTLVTALASATAVVIGAINTIKLNHAVSQVQKIEVATNSMKDKLVAATAEGEFAKGKAEGRAEVVTEQQTGKP